MKTLEWYLEKLGRLKYNCYGVPMFNLVYIHHFRGGYWTAFYRNPVFGNPDFKAKTPLGACEKMYEHLTKEGLINE